MSMPNMTEQTQTQTNIGTNTESGSGGQTGDGGREILTEDAIRNLLHHDPLSEQSFASPEKPPKVETKPAVVTQPQQPQPQPQTVAQPGQATATAEEVAALRAQIAVYERQSQQRPQETQPQPKKEEYQLPNYMMQMPQQLMQALASDDMGQRAQALTALLSVVSRTIHQTVRNEYLGEIQKMREAVPTSIREMTESQSNSRAVFQDFYTTYPMLNKAALYPAVAYTAGKLMQERPDLFAGGWNERAREALAERVSADLGIVIPKKNGQAGPHIVNSGGSRPAQSKPLVGQERLIADLFD